ncbi:Abi family protein [Rodentibacter myodis]|uniref:Abortive phage infection protein n=1 Tax=Rodentibacter myodis TaxID=1907939 RepID=A0A1V3JHF0_9PAST|nr:Abi family protein [Rodentibacter myodis]OOF56033.1 abortive phage infection protein [Rodentibacter myodis]
MTNSTKPHKEYLDLINQLKQRGMIIQDEKYAEKKLSQVGYYRLSGFWHISRTPNQDRTFSDNFIQGTDFNEIYRLYIFDKKLRLLLLDIIERLEINIRTIMAHELGRINPLAYEDHSIINRKFLQHNWNPRSSYLFSKWQDSLTAKIERCKDDFIEWHRKNENPLPFWVITETWDFGTLSKYYSLLNGQYQRKIAKHFNIDERTLTNWLNEINIVRNLAAHHSRVWNRDFNQINIPNFNSQSQQKFKRAGAYFSNINLDNKAKSRIFGRIAVLWYLISQNSSNYQWLQKLKELIETFPNIPNAKLESMGLMSHLSLPIHLMN